MEKYLFTDRTNVVREVQSKEELESFIRATGDTNHVRIWPFNSSQWLSYAEYLDRKTPRVLPVVNKASANVNAKLVPVRRPAQFNTLGKLFIALLLIAGVFLIYNFSRVRWYTASSLLARAERPANMPLMNLDSLVYIVESGRGKKLDKVTLTNFRIRNSWPERIELILKSDRDSSQSGNRFYNVEVSIDNSTGYMIDEAIVELQNWKNGSLFSTDTLHLDQVGYTSVARRILPGEFKSDSLTVAFLQIRSRAFNFCYARDKESNYGNLNDRWFCRD
mgnify:CR=1 FL=1